MRARGRRGDGRLADATLAGEQQDPHGAGGYPRDPVVAPRARASGAQLDRLDLLLQLLQRAAHDQARGPPLEQPGQRDREVDRELVVDACRLSGPSGSKRYAAVEAAQHVAFDELPRERVGSIGVVVLEHVADALAERGGAELDLGAPSLVVALEDRSPASRRAPTRDTTRSRGRRRGSGRPGASTRMRSLACRPSATCSRSPRRSPGAAGRELAVPRTPQADEPERQHRHEHGERVGPRGRDRDDDADARPRRAGAAATSVGADPCEEEQARRPRCRRRGLDRTTASPNA